MSVSCSACINKHLEHRLCTHNCSACVYIATSVRADKCHLLDLTSPTDCQYLKLNQLLYKVYTLHFVCKYCILQCTLSIECPPANCLFKNSHQPNCSCVMSIYLIDCLQNRVKQFSLCFTCDLSNYALLVNWDKHGMGTLQKLLF